MQLYSHLMYLAARDGVSINNTRGCGEVPPLLFGAFPALSLSV